MKKKLIDKKILFSMSGIVVLCLGLIIGSACLNYEPKENFEPATIETNDTLAETWDDKLEADAPVEASIKEEPLYTGEVTDNTQTIISEDENGSIVELSGSTTKEEASESTPPEKPVPVGDTTNKDEVPSYSEDVAVVSPSPAPASDSSESSHPGQVYDPVFGWFDAGTTTFDIVDSDGDINKQISTMGE